MNVSSVPHQPQSQHTATPSDLFGDNVTFDYSPLSLIDHWSDTDLSIHPDSLGLLSAAQLTDLKIEPSSSTENPPPAEPGVSPPMEPVNIEVSPPMQQQHEQEQQQGQQMFVPQVEPLAEPTAPQPIVQPLFNDSPIAFVGQGPRLVVESYRESIVRQLFAGEIPRAAAGYRMAKPALARSRTSPGVWKIAVAHLASGTKANNRVVIGRLLSNPWSLRLSDCGWRFRDRVADVRWINEDLVAVAHGSQFAVYKANEASVSATRKGRVVEGDASAEVTMNEMAIRETDVFVDDTHLAVAGSEQGTVALIDWEHGTCSRRNLGSPASSARADAVEPWRCSFTTEDRRVHIFDRRSAWAPVHVSTVAAGSVAVTSHDWIDSNSVAVATINGNVIKIDVRMEGTIDSVFQSNTICDIHASRLGKEVAVFGESSFSLCDLATKEVWFAPAAMSDFQDNILGCYIDANTIISTSNDGMLRIWTTIRDNN